jgi:hypothetical protein
MPGRSLGESGRAGAADNSRSTNQAGKPPAAAAREHDFKNERRETTLDWARMKWSIP